MSKTILFVIGLLSGLLLVHSYNLIFKKDAPVISTTETIHTVERTDTSTAVKGVSSISPAKIIYMPSDRLHISPGESGNLPKPDSSLIWYEEVAAWDTTTADGFKADVKYFTQSKYFQNSFEYPERIITKEKETTKTVNTVQTVSTIPEWQLGIGAKGLFQENKFEYAPFLSLSYNTKIWFAFFEFQGKALTQFDAGRIKMEPELSTQIKIEL